MAGEAPPGTTDQDMVSRKELRLAANDEHAWHRWRVDWQPAGPGDHELCCRASDTAGNTQPLAPVWNLGGYAVNEIHRVRVTVRGGA